MGSTEIELKLALSPRAAREFASFPLLAEARLEKHRLVSTYYDTPDLSLRGNRVALRFRKKGWQWLLTVKSAEPASGGLALRSEWEKPAQAGQFDFSHVDNPVLRSQLERQVDSLVPVFTTDFRRHAWTLNFRNSVIEIALDQGHIESQGKTVPICEVELELMAGYIGDVFALTRLLQDHTKLHPTAPSKAERGYALFTGEKPRPFRARPLPINAEQSPVEAFRQIALGCLEHLQRNEDGLIGDNPEFVHQARVALRRMRSATRLFAPILPADFVSVYGRAWQALARALGEARNWDVFTSETLPPMLAAFPTCRDGQRLLKEGKRKSRKARETLGELLALPEYSQLLVEFTAALFALQDESQLSLTAFAEQRLSRRARQARRLATRLGQLDSNQRHRMRITFKKLRYALEFFAPLMAGKRLTRYLAALTQLQDELGQINDQVTAEQLLNSVLSARDPGPLHGWVAGRHALLLAELPESIAVWLTQRSPWKYL